MFYEWLPFFRAGLFAGAILFANYDMWVALDEIGVDMVGTDDISKANYSAGAAKSAFVYFYLPEIIGGVVFFVMASAHLFLQKTNDDGRRKIWPVELFFVVLAVIFAFFTTGFDELQKLFSRY